MIGIEGKYRTIVADPPWPMRWNNGSGSRLNGSGKRFKSPSPRINTLPYPTMSLDEIAALTVAELAEPNAVLFLWSVDSFLISGEAARIARAWGFEPRRLLIWHKTGFGLGSFPRPQHETCLLCTRGTVRFRLKNVGSVQKWKIVYTVQGGKTWRKHSAKPDGFLDLVEQATEGPYLELFARVRRLGWTSWGNEV